MTTGKRKFIVCLFLVPLLYWSATAAMINYSTHYLSNMHGCTVVVPFDHTGFLISMGRRSVPAIERQIADPNVGMNSKIHLAWILGRMGNYSQFPIFIEGLQSRKSHRFIAIMRMQDFPQERLRYLPAILAVDPKNQDDHYRNLLIALAYQNHLPDDKIEAIAVTMDDAQSDQRGFNDREIRQLTRYFAATTERKSRYWATGANSARNSSNASRQ